MPKITELIGVVEGAGTLKEAKRAVAELTRDRRRRVTPALRRTVLRMAHHGIKPSVITRSLNGELSAPTVRKIIREEKAKC